MGYREAAGRDPWADALEELRTVDRLLADKHVVARLNPADLHRGLLATLSGVTEHLPFGPFGPSIAAQLEAEQDDGDLCITEALALLQRALWLTGGHLWNGGLSSSGSPWLLHTSVGLRSAAREYFERLVAADPLRFPNLEPLAPLEGQAPARWPASATFGVIVLAILGGLALVLARLAGTPPVAFALIPLTGVLVWLGSRRRARSRLLPAAPQSTDRDG